MRRVLIALLLIASSAVSVTSPATPASAAPLQYLQTLTSGRNYSCALTAKNGSKGSGVQCWGDNSYGELGNGSTRKSALPVPVSGLTSNVISIVAANNGAHTCAVKTDNSLWCWGDNSQGELGDGTVNGPQHCGLGKSAQSCSMTPLRVKSLKVKSVTLGTNDTCAITLPDFSPQCWGGNNKGQLGIGSTSNTPQSSPHSLSVPLRVQVISASDDHTCAISNAFDVYCWGYNYHGALGMSFHYNDLKNQYVNAPTQVSLFGADAHFGEINEIATGTDFTCAVTTDSREALCWGVNTAHELGQGNPPTPLAQSDTPLAVGTGGFAELSASGDHACAMTLGGTVECWGSGSDGGAQELTSPAAVSGLGIGTPATDGTDIATGTRHTCARQSPSSTTLLAGRSIVCWGDDSAGEYGNGEFLSHRTGFERSIVRPPGAPVLVGKTDNSPRGHAGAQHQTEIAPSSFANGSTTLTAWESGHFTTGGSTAISYHTSPVSSPSQTSPPDGTLPGLPNSAQSYDRVEDPSVGFSANNGEWLVASVENNRAGTSSSVVVSRSTDGLKWDAPIPIATSSDGGHVFEKTSLTCDNNDAARAGYCYVAYDDGKANGISYVATSTDSGKDWLAPVPVPNELNMGSTLIVQPACGPARSFTGCVVVLGVEQLSPAPHLKNVFASFISTDGGKSFPQSPNPIAFNGAPPFASPVAGNLQSRFLMSATVDPAGSISAAWSYCELPNPAASTCPKKNSHDGIEFATSPDGVNWLTTALLSSSAVDYFLPTIAADPNTGSFSAPPSAHLALTYYAASVGCGSHCNVSIGFMSSLDTGNDWTRATPLTGPFSAKLLATTANSDKTVRDTVGDRMSIVFVNGVAYPRFVIALPRQGIDPLFEAVYTASDTGWL